MHFQLGGQLLLSADLQHPGLEWLIFIKVLISHLYDTHNQAHT